MNNQSSATETAKEKTGFGADDLKRNAAIYQKHKRLVDAVSAKYDSPDDAVAALREVVVVLEAQIENGSGYTPDRALGFGSDSAKQIGEKILGLGTSDSECRKAFAAMGK